MNKKRIILTTLSLFFALVLGGIATYLLMPDKVVIQENNNTITEYVPVYIDSCVDTDTSDISQSDNTFYSPNGIRPMNQQSYPTEPHKAYYVDSTGKLRPAGSTYTNKPSKCAMAHDISLC